MLANLPARRQRVWKRASPHVRYKRPICHCSALGLGLEGRVPDAKTVWLYREQLTQAGVIEIDGYLKDQGYLAVIRRPRHWSGRQEYQSRQSWPIGAFPAVGGW